MAKKKKQHNPQSSFADHTLIHIEKRLGKKIDTAFEKQTKLFDIVYRNLLNQEIGKVNNRLDSYWELVKEQFIFQKEQINTRFDEQEEKFSVRFEKIDARFDEHEKKFNARFDAHDKRFDSLEAKMDLLISLIRNTPTREEFNQLKEKVDLIDKRPQLLVN